MKILFQVQNRALGFFRVASVLLIGAKTQPCCGLCLPDCCALPSYPPSSGYPCCPPSYCVQNVVVGPQDNDRDKTNNNEQQTNDQCFSYPQLDCSTYCSREPRACCQEDHTILRRVLASLQQQQQQQQQCCRRRSYVDPCCCSGGTRSSFSDPSLAFSSSGARSLSDPGAMYSSSGFGSFSDSSMGLSSALRSILDPSFSSSGLISASDPSSLLSSSASRSSLLLDPFILSQISDPQTINSYYDPSSSSSYSYDPCCNPCATTSNPCSSPCNPCCNPCCRVVRQQPCCKRTQRRVILIDNVTPETCFV